MGGGGSSGPTQQQVDLQTEQAMTNAQLNLEENQQRKTVLNAMYGTRVFRGSALSRAIAGNTQDKSTAPTSPAAPSAGQVAPAITANGASLLDNIAGGVAGSPGAVAAPTGSSSAGRGAGSVGRSGGGGGIGSGR